MQIEHPVGRSVSTLDKPPLDDPASADALRAGVALCSMVRVAQDVRQYQCGTFGLARKQRRPGVMHFVPDRTYVQPLGKFSRPRIAHFRKRNDIWRFRCDQLSDPSEIGRFGAADVPE